MTAGTATGARTAVDSSDLPLARLLADEHYSHLVIAASKDANAKVTVLLLPRSPGADALCLKLATTCESGDAVGREAALLVATDRSNPAAAAVPEVVALHTWQGKPALLTRLRPGAPMSTSYHRWRHTARPARVRHDFRVVASWLGAWQEQTAAAPRRLDMRACVPYRIERRYAHRADLPLLLDRLEGAYTRLSAAQTPAVTVHGDLWAGNILVTRYGVAGIVDWEAGTLGGEPVRDLVRFVLAYSLYLDRHTRPGAPVAGHPGLSATRWGAGIVYALTGSGWYPKLVRGFLAAGLTRLGAPAELWFDAALAGIAEVAASADDLSFGDRHLDVLATLLRLRPVARAWNGPFPC